MTLLPLADTGAARGVEAVYRPRHPLDLRATLGIHRRGSGDPTMTVDRHVVWRALHTPEGVGTIAIRSRGDEVLATAWGSGARWLLAQLPRLCGADDDPAAFDPAGHSGIAEAHRRHPGLRLSASDAVSDAFVTAVLEQKVTGLQAHRAWRYLVQRLGVRAPGPTPRPMHAAPPWELWRRVPSWTWHRAGVEPPQSRAVVDAAARGTGFLERLASADHRGRDAMLTSMRGIGAWTSAEVRLHAFGDPDAVSVGDAHLSHHVGYALAGSRVDDDGMLELLEPWRGQRQRVIRLLGYAGAREPRRGPRLHPEDHRGR